MSTPDLPEPVFANNMRIIGHTDQGGRSDGVQVMVNRGYAYVGHFFSNGFTVIDVRDPRNPKPVKFVPAPPGSWSIHLQSYGDLLLVINAKNMFGDDQFADKRNYYRGSVGLKVGTSTGKGKKERNWTAGIAVYDISKRDDPKQIGFAPVEGIGVHRLWYVGGRWAYGSALLDGYTDYIFITIDLQDPTKPRVAGRYALPGMNAAAGEKPDWPERHRYGLHHPIINGDTAYCAWRDGGLVVLNVADRENPKLIVHRNWCPPFNGGTHNCLPLSDRDLLVVVDEAVLDRLEDGIKYIWMFDIREKSNPISISTFPTPSEADYGSVGGHFGPHNIHENRPGTFVSSDLIFATYQNAGVRVFDIRDRFRPVEVGALVPPPPKRLIDHRPGAEKVIQLCDVFVDAQGILYVTDSNAGFFTMTFDG